jgi:hypothetical protein
MGAAAVAEFKERRVELLPVNANFDGGGLIRLDL